MFVRAAMVLIRAARFHCKRQAALFWAFEMLLSQQPFAVAELPRPPASMERHDRAASHRTGLHLSFLSWSARYYGAAERNAPARSQRDKNRLPRPA